ncbi:VanZ like protein [Nonlabens dokdonensis]|jgi:VanZ family protein|uniref:Membrane protein n=2 Tax=Nonlabens dokdonensis TaxID=328515 RepID=L7W3Q3_NONDD|nr:VanZ family protein [Nonlabens dokdonensis]AGC76200.1 membrane protein [Nonlabens dokdonensis DSW-6]PZX43869.1 VanZ like protein [Nonlabens dokdonensis]
MSKLIYWTAPFYTAVIVIGSLVDNAVPSVSIDHVDKWYHAFAYLIMNSLWYIFFYSRYLNKQGLSNYTLGTVLKSFSRPVIIGSSVLSFIIGVLIELGQEFISLNRTMDIMDVLANFTGIILAALFLWILNNSLNKY